MNSEAYILPSRRRGGDHRAPVNKFVPDTPLGGIFASNSSPFCRDELEPFASGHKRASKDAVKSSRQILMVPGGKIIQPHFKLCDDSLVDLRAQVPVLDAVIRMAN